MVRIPLLAPASSISPGPSRSNPDLATASDPWRASLPDGLVHDLIAPVTNGTFDALVLGTSLLSDKSPATNSSIHLAPLSDSPHAAVGAGGASGGVTPSAGTEGSGTPNAALVRSSAGTMTGGPASPETFLTLSTGSTGVRPLIAVAALSVGNNGYIPVNANDTNGSPLTNGIPQTRDFSAAPILGGDPELIQASATYLPGKITGISVVNNGNGIAFLWADQQKLAPLSGFTPAPTVTFYIEGLRPSSTIGDITLSATYVDNAPGSTPRTVSTTITVTPIVTNFTVTPHAAPSVVFWDGMDGLSGLATDSQGAPGAAFNAQVTQTGVGGTGIFIQNFVGMDNGAGGAAAGWVFTAASGLPNLNSVLTNGAKFPVLDKVGDPPPPVYDVQFSTAGSTADTLKMEAADSPATGNPTNSDKLQNIDVTYRLTLYVVWRFADNSIYTLASDNWQVAFRADTNVPGSGVTNIRAASGVSASHFVLTNADVPALTAPIANNVVKIQ
jgi:hypothetical protein